MPVRRRRGPLLAHADGMDLISVEGKRRREDLPRALPADISPFRTADSDDIVNLPEVARYVLDIVFTNGDNVPSHRSLVWSCVRYGVSRYLLGQPSSAIDEELALLKLATEQRIRRTFTVESERDRALVMLDRSLAVADKAARLGWNREALRENGRWDAELQRVLRSSPFVTAA